MARNWFDFYVCRRAIHFWMLLVGSHIESRRKYSLSEKSSFVVTIALTAQSNQINTKQKNIWFTTYLGQQTTNPFEKRNQQSRVCVWRLLQITSGL